VSYFPQAESIGKCAVISAKHLPMDCDQTVQYLMHADSSGTVHTDKFSIISIAEPLVLTVGSKQAG
jgi:hypothetical protein